MLKCIKYWFVYYLVNTVEYKLGGFQWLLTFLTYEMSNVNFSLDL